MMKFQSLAGAVLMVGVSILSLAGCAHDGDVRDSHDCRSAVLESLIDHAL
ncbi:hypothetical protein H4C80_03985 [Pseudomonas juntendi]|uniref:Lipoprotein n=1 Tax=Pseudomonas juntendi TaxID=2666183 RepID=A0A7W2KD68_9PSED|nr:hypothetical protein [Pseudomonas juntendi]MBA6096306.1 hypothetical protein [Pseudomonas juntendi]